MYEPFFFLRTSVMTRKSFVVLVAFVWLAPFSNDRADAQWGQSNRNRSGSRNQSNGISEFFGGLGKAIDSANRGRNGPEYDDNQQIIRPPRGPKWEDVFEDSARIIIDNANKQGYRPPRYPPDYRPRVYPSYVKPQPVYKPKTKVKSNELPVAKPEPKKIVVVPVAANSFSLNGSTITAADIHNTTEDAKDHVDSKTEEIREDMTG